MNLDELNQLILESLPIGLNEHETLEAVPRLAAMIKHLVQTENQIAVDLAAQGWKHVAESAEKTGRADAISEAVSLVMKAEAIEATNQLRQLARDIRALTNKPEPESERVEREQLFGGEYFSA